MMTTAQELAEVFWADKEWKKFVVTLERGPHRHPEKEIKYVRARNRSAAIACARQHAFTVKSPSRVGCRLATAYDLGCRPEEEAMRASAGIDMTEPIAGRKHRRLGPNKKNPAPESTAPEPALSMTEEPKGTP